MQHHKYKGMRCLRFLYHSTKYKHINRGKYIIVFSEHTKRSTDRNKRKLRVGKRENS